ncbi:alpha/beta fold hydrolase [Streptomyces sp. NPDC056637]|uniref:alpha/beta fold hydrolase n=1 Tax=unclassified Streptomyces TaxID=2593676 RepID=UPI0036BC8EB2
MPSAASSGVRRVTLTADHRSTPLTGLLAVPEPAHGPSRALVVALHGGGMSAAYFDGQAHPDVSLLALGARLGYTVLALDRPGYGQHAGMLSKGRTVREQVDDIGPALEKFVGRRAIADREDAGGVLLLGHSYGAKVALALAGDRPPRGLLGVDVSGIGLRPAELPEQGDRPGRFASRRLNWGPSFDLYPPGTFRTSQSVVAPMPRREADSAGDWKEWGADVLGRVRVPVRFTFAEHEAWWRHGPDEVAELTGRLTDAPRVVVDRLARAGHNISLGWVARAYHLRVFAFLEECLEADRARADRAS